MTRRTVLRILGVGVCNALLAPLGYFVVGAWRTGLVVSGLVLMIGSIAFEITLARPPGLYAFGAHFLLGIQLFAMVLVGVHAAWLARRPKSNGSLAARLGMGLLVGSALIVAGLGIRAYWPVSVYDIHSASMQPSLRQGDVVAVRGARAVCGRARPQPGQTVVYIRPGTHSRYLHRLIAGPGQTVAIDGTVVTIDGRVVQDRSDGRAPGEGPDGFGQAVIAHEQLGSGRAFSVQHLGDVGDPGVRIVKLRAGQWFVMGDNREDALDSRFFGPVSTAALCGVGFRILRSGNARRVGEEP